MRIKNVKNKVTETLKRHKTARDNDMQLLAIIWNQEVGGKDKAEKYIRKVKRKEKIKLYLKIR